MSLNKIPPTNLGVLITWIDLKMNRINKSSNIYKQNQICNINASETKKLKVLSKLHCKVGFTQNP